jgi:hypothetical protein
MTPLALVQQDRLGELAAQVRVEHRAVLADARSMLLHAVAAGEALLEAKALIGHGSWLNWLSGVGLEPRTAQRYMRIARNTSAVSYLPNDASMRDALDALSRPRPRPSTRQERLLELSRRFSQIQIMGAYELESPTRRYFQRQHYAEAIADRNPEAAIKEIATLQYKLDRLRRHAEKCERKRRRKR